ncbi:MAG: ABC transporter permease [Tissierellia bacterium]|nr:ABC transporter permease [Tissierellia bacterium]
MEAKKHKKKGPIVEVLQRLGRNKTAMVGLAIVIMLIVAAVTSPFFYDYDEVIIKQNIPERLQHPSKTYIFGTDDLGRQIFPRIIYGARVSLSVGFSAVAIAFIVGGFLGAVGGYYGGVIDNVIMRFMDIFLAIPGTLFAITIAAALGSNIRNLIIALAISSVPGFARIIRSSVITVRDVEYIEAARAIGAKDSRIVLNHVIPNALAPVIVHTTLNVASIILTIAGLSFLGLGVAPPTPEWGAMLSAGRTYIVGHSYMTAFPGFAIMITILALNLLGDGLRDALDPRLK